MYTAYGLQIGGMLLGVVLVFVALGFDAVGLVTRLLHWRQGVLFVQTWDSVVFTVPLMIVVPWLTTWLSQRLVDSYAASVKYEPERITLAWKRGGGVLILLHTV